MPKFNLKNYKPSDGDAHLNQQLADEKRAKIPEDITEKQLETHRASQPEQVTEKQLDAVRQNNEPALPEARLNEAKANFGIKHRNAEAHTGDINKVEEQRLSNKNRNETEKYEVASAPAKDRRWWENKEGNKDLKIAKKTASLKDVLKKIAEDIAQGDDDLDEKLAVDSDFAKEHERDVRRHMEHMWPEMETGVGDEGVDAAPAASAGSLGTHDRLDVDNRRPASPTSSEMLSSQLPDSPTKRDFADLSGLREREMWLVEKKDSIGGEDSDKYPQALGGLPYTVKMTVGFDPAEWPSIDEARVAALHKILEARPDLEDKISTSDISKHPKYVGDQGFLTMRLVGDEYNPDATTNGPDGADVAPFAEEDFNTADAGGTPVYTGKVSIKSDLDISDRETLMRDIVEFLNDLHPELNLTPESIDLDLSAGTASYAIAAGGERVAAPSDGGASSMVIDETPPVIDGEPEVEPPNEHEDEQLSSEPSVEPTVEDTEFPVEEKPALPPAGAASSHNIVTAKKK